MRITCNNYYLSLFFSLFLSLSLSFHLSPHSHIQEKLNNVVNESRGQDTDALIPDSEGHDDTQEPDNR